MKCRFCKAKLRETDKTCPSCGKKNPQPEKDTAVPSLRRKVIMVGCVVLLTALAVILLLAMLSGWNIGNWFGWLKPKANDVYCKNSYTVSDKKAYRNRNEVVATMGDAQLTNGQLQIYYWMQVCEFLDTYGDMASYLGLDYTADLADQTSADGESTWQQYFLESALQMWQTNQAFANAAAENGYVLPQEHQDYLDQLPETLNKAATEQGYDSADAMLQAQMGAGCTAEDYIAYMQVYHLGYQYFTQLYNAIDPSEEEILAYFEDNQSSFAGAGITQNDDRYVDVRHILIAPSGGTEHEDGSITYSEAAWTACLEEARQVMTLWEESDQTQEQFVSLVALYSDDVNSRDSGGLCLDIVAGDMETAFDAWCFDHTRAAGDYGLVKTGYGYHIIYFLDAEEIWHAEARTGLRESMGRELVDDLIARYNFQVTDRDIVLSQMKIGE